jgi:hypothetical protein
VRKPHRGIPTATSLLETLFWLRLDVPLTSPTLDKELVCSNLLGTARMMQFSGTFAAGLFPERLQGAAQSLETSLCSAATFSEGRS